MALTQQQLEARIADLQKARDSGVLTIRHGDTMTTFRSLAELEAILGKLQGELAGLSTTPRIRSIRVYAKDGW